MSERSEERLLASEIAKQRTLLAGLREEFSQALEQDLPKLGRTQRAAIMVAGIIESYYTCAETAFLRISQFFESSLRPDRWHTDLSELMRFRHFKRYYFSLAYEWDRLDAVVERLERVHPGLDAELERFSRLLEKL